VRIAAQLHVQSRVGLVGEVGSHDGNRAAKKREWASGHPRVLDWQQTRQSPLRCTQQHSNRLKRALPIVNFAEFASADMVALLASAAQSLSNVNVRLASICNRTVLRLPWRNSTLRHPCHILRIPKINPKASAATRSRAVLA
jgi:hypothetical protein